MMTLKEFLCVVIAGVLSLVFHNLAEAGETLLELHTVSYHINRDANYNEENFGFGIRHHVDNKEFNYVNAGFYKNSENNTSRYIGIGYEWPVGDFKLGIKVGIVDGYSLLSVLPYVVPVIRYKKVSIVFAPYPEAVAHLTIDILKF